MTWKAFFVIQEAFYLIFLFWTEQKSWDKFSLVVINIYNFFVREYHEINLPYRFNLEADIRVWTGAVAYNEPSVRATITTIEIE